MRIYLNIEQHETDNPTVTIYSPSVLELTGTRDSKGVYTLTSENPIFTEGTGVFTTRQDYLTDLSSGDLYGSRVDDYNVLRLCVCLPLAQGFNLTTNLMGQIAQNRC
jgi:hypothetical protein